MEFFMKMPRNKGEFAIFLLIVSVISVNLIAPLITFFEFGFSLERWFNVLRVIPFIWLSVVALVLLTFAFVEEAVNRVIERTDSFNARVMANILCSVFVMSIFMTVIGTWIGSRSISFEPIVRFFHKWPRNFSISLFIEALIAQPIARSIMVRIHLAADARR